MTEADTNLDEKDTNVKNQRLIRFDFSKVSLAIGFGGVLVGVLISCHFEVSGPFGVIGLVFGIIGLSQRKRLGKKKISCRPPIMAICLNMFLIILASFSSTCRQREEYVIVRRMFCSVNINSLGKGILVYAYENNSQYPTAEKWCDLLIRDANVSENQFICKGAASKDDKGRGHYALNPNCKPNSPSDTVLLFETKGGWNQFGGSKILTIENHSGVGCNVTFNDGAVAFIKAEELDKLNWGDEQENN